MAFEKNRGINNTLCSADCIDFAEWPDLHTILKYSAPKNTIITFEGKTAYNALEGQATGKSQELVYNLPISGSDLTCNGKTYKSVGLCYIFPESEKQTADITLDFYGDKNVVIRENLLVPHVPLQINYRTSIVGNMFTSSLRYNVSIDTNFSDSSVVEEF